LRAKPEQILVVGGSGGIGQALVDELLTRFPEAQIAASYHQVQPRTRHERLCWQALDVRDSLAIDSWASAFKRVDWIVNAAGYLHGNHGGPEKAFVPSTLNSCWKTSASIACQRCCSPNLSPQR
jgi:nucleoside-diphosphate-sugar epimerase